MLIACENTKKSLINPFFKGVHTSNFVVVLCNCYINAKNILLIKHRKSLEVADRKIQLDNHLQNEGKRDFFCMAWNGYLNQENVKVILLLDSILYYYNKLYFLFLKDHNAYPHQYSNYSYWAWVQKQVKIMFVITDT